MKKQDKPQAFNVKFPNAQLHRDLKIFAALRGVKMNDVVVQALEEFVAAHKQELKKIFETEKAA